MEHSSLKNTSPFPFKAQRIHTPIDISQLEGLAQMKLKRIITFHVQKVHKVAKISYSRALEKSLVYCFKTHVKRTLNFSVQFDSESEP